MSFPTTDWKSRSKCLDLDTNFFFMKETAVKKIEKAVRFCNGTRDSEDAVCPVKTECLEYALRTESDYGIWGGTTPIQRSRIKRTREAKNGNQ